jgi:hypothetical protein
VDQIAASARQRYTGPGGLINVGKDIAKLTRMLNVENKHLEGFLSLAVVDTSTTSCIAPMITVAEGSDGNQRTGRSIKINKIDLNLHAFVNTGAIATATETCQIFNYYLVRYKKTPSVSGAAAFPIIDFINQDSAGHYTPMSMFNPDLAENFQVLEAGQITLDFPFPSAGTNTYNVDRMVQTSHECSFHQTFSSSSAASIIDNMLHLVVVALNPLNTGGASQVDVSYRLWFVDN